MAEAKEPGSLEVRKIRVVRELGIKIVWTWPWKVVVTSAVAYMVVAKVMLHDWCAVSR